MGGRWPRAPKSGNNAARLSDSGGPRRARRPASGAKLLNNPRARRIFLPMMTRALLLALGLTFGLALPASAACYADYKAKRGEPVQYLYGVAELSDDDCSREAAAPEIAGRIARDGWELLSVMSVFGDEGLDGPRENAGDNFLRY